MTTTNATYQQTMTDSSVPDFHDMNITLGQHGIEYVLDDWEDYEFETDEPVEDIQSEHEHEPDHEDEPDRLRLPPQITEIRPGGNRLSGIRILPPRNPTDTPVFDLKWKNIPKPDAVPMDFSKGSYKGPVQEFELTPLPVLNPSKNPNRFCNDRLSLNNAEELQQVLNNQNTRPCSYKLNGHCKYGGKCHFAHDIAELRCTPCEHGSECYSKETSCKFCHPHETRHDVWTRLCKISREFFDKAKAEKASSKAVCEMVNKLQKTRPCLHFINGHCDKGDKCTFAHGPFDLKLTPCKFGNGCHKKNDNCEFYHSQCEHPGDLWTRLCQLEKTKDKSRQKQDKSRQKQDKSRQKQNKTRQKQEKTRPCYHQLVDHCRDGDKCKFAHNVREFNPIPCMHGSECYKKKTCQFCHPSESRQKVWTRLCAIEKAKKNV